ncbi:MAG: ATP-binding cassette domain-containing protein, partial [Planctomycetota bacterium]
ILVEARALSKSYGHTRAAREVSFQLARGEILGFLGPNGAGKSTTLKMVTGILQPDAGTASVDGIDILEDPLEARRRFGYLPESLPLYWEMQVEEYLRFIARARGRGAPPPPPPPRGSTPSSTSSTSGGCVAGPPAPSPRAFDSGSASPRPSSTTPRC